MISSLTSVVYLKSVDNKEGAMHKQKSTLKARICVKHTSLFRPPIKNYGLIAFTLTYLSVEQ